MNKNFEISDNEFIESDNRQTILLSTAYLPPVSYFASIMQADKVYVEAHENYIKQTYRNRCVIFEANGTMNLNVPIEKPIRGKNGIRDIRIANYENWQQQHWRSIVSAYNTSPFFEYYEDDFRPFYEKKWNFLWDYNRELLILLLYLLDIEKGINDTEKFLISHPDKLDLREKIHPKKKSIIDTPAYYQVFQQKFGFQADLSVIDLLFNMGNESILVLLKSICKV